MLSWDSVTGDLCSHRPAHAEFRETSFWLELGRTSSRRILLVKTVFILADVACFSCKVQEFASVSPLLVEEVCNI